MKSFDEFVFESENEDELNKILDSKKKFGKERKSKLVKLGKKVSNEMEAKKQRVNQHIEKLDSVIYERTGSEHDGKSGVVISIRKDGKCVVRFEDGSRLAANPIRLTKKKSLRL